MLKAHVAKVLETDGGNELVVVVRLENELGDVTYAWGDLHRTKDFSPIRSYRTAFRQAEKRYGPLKEVE